MTRILLIEDDETIREGTTAYLESEGYQVTALSQVRSVEELDQLAIGEYQLLLLDLMLPGLSGPEILAHLRTYSQLPVLVLTSLSDEATQLELFDLACDDYLTKPFSLLILKRRMEAVLRRTQQATIWQHGEAEVNFDSYAAKLRGEPVKLTTKELQVLQVLVNHPDQALTRDQLLDQVYGPDAPYDRTIDVYVKNLRQKLELDCIQTVKGVGYRYEA